jgi:hypothetical protein
MDESKLSTSPHGLCEGIGADQVPIAVDVRRPADPHDKLVVRTRDQAERLSADPPRESSSIVYCDNEQELREGFAIALRAMGIEANFLHADTIPRAAISNRKDH